MNLTVKICRATGRPITLQDIESYNAEFARLFDIAERVCKKDMLRLQTKMAKIERLLQDKFPTVADIEMPSSEQAWKDYLEKYGATIVTTRRDTGSLVLVIDDVEEMKY